MFRSNCFFNLSVFDIHGINFHWPNNMSLSYPREGGFWWLAWWFTVLHSWRLQWWQLYIDFDDQVRKCLRKWEMSQVTLFVPERGHIRRCTWWKKSLGLLSITCEVITWLDVLKFMCYFYFRNFMLGVGTGSSCWTWYS